VKAATKCLIHPRKRLDIAVPVSLINNGKEIEAKKTLEYHKKIVQVSDNTSNNEINTTISSDTVTKSLEQQTPLNTQLPKETSAPPVKSLDLQPLEKMELDFTPPQSLEKQLQDQMEGEHTYEKLKDQLPDDPSYEKLPELDEQKFDKSSTQKQSQLYLQKSRKENLNKVEQAAEDVKNHGEHKVNCLGCGIPLQYGDEAQVIQCPKCHAVMDIEPEQTFESLVDSDSRLW